VILAQAESGADHQAARDERPSSQQQHEGDHRQAGHDKRYYADSDVEDAFEDEQHPSFAWRAARTAAMIPNTPSTSM
jgi:hypothetical protein